ncbi:larval cuticle protein LCP-30 isoform X1 [Drosophila obscura]|uniref:larval cuticle protein LCP-30 isoform X1 n=1 Tax=Drosophila obscura TaxID=7282 RepID=UPI001BB1342E|nr:larval cuticle protein LCP-30 isoform X1 [Drosophila obscura]
MFTQSMLRFSAVAVVALIAVCHTSPVPDEDRNGKYTVSEQNSSAGRYRSLDDGRYHPSSQNEGRYQHMPQPYTHVTDHRELGAYHHIPNPYDGGYGPYAGLNLPYVHDVRPYNHDLYTSTTTTTTKKPTTTTERTTTTTTTTTTTPRNILFNYDDEGRHKILHQEEIRKKDKYDHAFLTENGIYGEEQAKLHHNGGTHAKGYYEYTGDDGKLYRVNYASNDGGFMPEGDHIPTPPPIPEAIARALKYVEEQHKANGGAQFDHRGFRINHMTKDIKAQIKSMHLERMPKELGDQIRMLEHEVELAEEEEREERRAEEERLERKRLSHLHPTVQPDVSE